MAYNYEYPGVNMNDYNNDWLINKVKDLANEWKNVQQNWTTQQEAFNNLKEYIENYFNNLNVQNEINNKIEDIIESGEFDAILKVYIDPALKKQDEKITVLETRVNEITQLPDGSTIGDAELTDIRVPAGVLDFNEPFSNAGNSVRGQATRLFNIIRNIYYGLLDNASIELDVLGNVDNNLSVTTYQVTVESSVYDYFGIVGYITPRSEINYIDISFVFESENPLTSVYVNALNVDGVKIEGILFKNSYRARIAFTSPKSEAGAINIFTKLTAPYKYKISHIVIVDSNGEHYAPSFIVNTSFGRGSITSTTKEYLALATKDYVNSIVEGGSYALKNWTILGDSLSSFSTLGSGANIYVDYVQSMIGIHYTNLAIGGSGYWKGHSSDEAFYQQAEKISNDSDVVTVFGSFNDIGIEGGVSGATIIGSYTDSGTDSIAGCINTTFDNIENICPNAVIGVILPTPWENSRNNPATTSYLNILKQICTYRNIPYLDLFNNSNLHPWDAEFRQLFYKTPDDGAHPNSAGHLRFSGMIVEFIKSLLLPISK